MNLVVVESPAKAKTIKKYLGVGYEVLASYGHVRDLPSKDGSVRPDDDFAMDWDVEPKAARHLKDIADAAKRADKLILATDPDREGEAISWHVLEVLKAKGLLADLPVERVAFNAITKKAVLEAVAHPRGIDRELVDAYLARRALDYLVGFTLSPVLWRKVPGSRSAGRVQSVALRLICERELEIEKFVREEYWTVETTLKTARGDVFDARLVELEGEKLKKFDLKDSEAALRAKSLLESGAFRVTGVEKKPARRHPAPPFITSTLQQEAARKLSFPAARTMQVAQRLYEGVDIDGETQGLITYMRTDGVQLTPEAVSEIRAQISKRFGARYLPDAPRLYKSKAKNAQEAHEAIRPTDVSRRPEDIARMLDPDQAKLYELIWKRTMASQMESAEIERTTADIDAANGHALLRATGQVITFDGYLTLYQESDDDAEGEDGRLPPLSIGDGLSLIAVKPSQHFTEPPPRYSEASLVKRLEELGIGRPSTYATILSVLRDRSYVRMDRARFVPEDKGRIVTAFLEGFFRRYVEYDFTASLEEKLDLISAGALSWKDLLRDFWREFIGAVDEIKDLKISEVIDALNEILGPHIFPPQPGGGDPRQCPLCAAGQLSLKLGRFGAFIGCSNYPDCSFTRPLTAPQEGVAGPKDLGADPATGEPVSLRVGRFGPYVQRGAGENGGELKRVKVPKDMPLDSIDLERALMLLSLPREVGLHPESGEPITANIGRYGPYLLHQGQYANLESSEEMFTVGLNRAVTLLAERKKRGGARRQSKALRELGAHPEDGKPVRVMEGRYGPYVTHERVNATLPKDMAPDKVTFEEALELLKARAARKTKRAPRKNTKPANGEGAKAKTKRGAGKKKKAATSRKAKPANDADDSETETGAKRAARASR